MTDPSGTSGPGAGTTPGRDVLRLVVLAATLAGFLLMHGIAAAGVDGAHCGAPTALLVTGDPHPTVDHSMTPVSGGSAGAPVVDDTASVDTPASPHNRDGLMIGCLLALMGTLAAIALRLLGGTPADATSAPAPRALAWLRTARGPPDPLFLSLCVFRL